MPSQDLNLQTIPSRHIQEVANNKNRYGRIRKVMDKKYNMSFTTGGLFYTESLKALEVYQEEQDWSETRKRILTENLIQARTQSTATRRVREICFRLEKLTDQQLQLLTTGAAQEQPKSSSICYGWLSANIIFLSVIL